MKARGLPVSSDLQLIGGVAPFRTPEESSSVSTAQWHGTAHKNWSCPTKEQR